MEYVEERQFTLRLEVRCGFPDDYDGEADGYAWWEEIAPLTAEIVQAAVAIAQRRSGWRVRPGNRGRSSEEEVTLIIERDGVPPK